MPILLLTYILFNILQIWVFNSRYTQYIPLSVYELQAWLGAPCIYGETYVECAVAAKILLAIIIIYITKRPRGLILKSGVPAPCFWLEITFVLMLFGHCSWMLSRALHGVLCVIRRHAQRMS